MKTKNLGFFVLTILLISFLMPFPLKAQQLKNIVGTVTDASTGKPVEGVSIKVKRTNAVVISNQAGKYGLKARNNDQLIFSSPDYESRTLLIGEKKVLNVLLRQNQKEENKLISIGYGSIKKRELAGSIAQVSMADLANVTVESFDLALAGRLAGVEVSASNGQPGTAASIVIRGVSSLIKSSTPLYVIDGTPIDNPDLGAINPDEIESLNILKDAAATSIYGSRGANGVVIIDTKRGKVGTSVINFNSAVGFQQPIEQIELLSPYDFVKYQIEVNEALAKQTYTPGELDTADPLYVANGRRLEDYKNMEGADWQQRILRTAPIQIHNLAVRGGDTQTKYALSGSIFNQQGVLVNSSSKRYQGRASMDQSLGKSARMGLTANYSRNTRIGEAVSVDGNNDFSSYAMYRAWAFRPVSGTPGVNLPDYDIDPLYNTPGAIRINPERAAQNAFRHSNTRNFFANAYVELDLFKNLQFKSTGSINTSKTRLDVFYNTLTPQGNANNALGVNGSFHKIEGRDLASENTLTYTNSFHKDHHLTLLAGFSYYDGMNEIFGYSVSNLPQERLGIYGLSEGIPYAGDSKGRKYSYKSYYGRASYNYKSKYLFTATFRSDESSLFSRGSHWGYSPSAAVAWNMKAEDFMKGFGAISMSKIRMSYGISGNNRLESLDYDSFFNNSLVYPGGSPVSILSLVNPALRWESTRQFDLGYDLGLLNDRIGFTFDYYRKTTGFAKSYTNLGSLENSGFEFSLNTVNLSSKTFRWTSGFNISFNSNEVLELAKNSQAFYAGVTAPANADPLYVSTPGKPMGMFYGYTFDGIYQLEDFDNPSAGVYVLKAGLPDNGGPRADIQPGHSKFKDLDGNGTINDNDKGIIGRSLPKHTGGFSNNFSYKGFDLNIFFQWLYGNQIYNANRFMFEGNSSLSDINQYGSYLDRWTPENRSNEFHKAGGQGPDRFQSDRYLEDGSYLRLKSVSLSYSIPRSLIKSLYLTGLKFHISAQNLLTFTKYTGLDPEVSARHSVLTRGFDYSAYPQARTISFGINAAF